MTLETPLHALHHSLGAKMVPFAGYAMPIQYEGIRTEHLHTRSHAGLFDVSHMGQILVKGTAAAAECEKLIPIEIESLATNQQRYGVFTNAQGGILDDLMVTRWADDLIGLVVNAACKHEDLAHLKQHLQAVEIEYLENHALLALQGPEAVAVIANYFPQLNDCIFMQGFAAEHNGALYRITRSGYTGEDGVEISLPADHAETFAKQLLAHENVKPIGLGARDSLRLEAGLCLYGHDMNSETSPIEASLLWSISKSRRPDGDKANGYIGSNVIQTQLADGVSKKRVGLNVDSKVPVREGAVIIDENENEVGIVTSGGFSPSLAKPIAMGYVEKSFSAMDTPLQAVVRGKKIPITVSKLPFVKQNYYRG